MLAGQHVMKQADRRHRLSAHDTPCFNELSLRHCPYMIAAVISLMTQHRTEFACV